MIYYKPIKCMIDATRLAKVIMNMAIYYYNLLDSIATDKRLLFISNLWFFYFLGIKRRLSIVFYL